MLPQKILTGSRGWTEEEVDGLKLLSSHVNFRTVKYQLEAFHEGMRHATTQGNYEALLTLLWLATWLADYKVVNRRWVDDGPFEPPQDMFRLVARQGLEEIADKSHNSIGLFMFLLRAHAESMPSHGSDIEAWAESIVTSNGSNDKDRAFASWVIGWSCQERCDELVPSRWGFGSGTERGLGEEVRRPFSSRDISRERIGVGRARMVEVLGDRARRFEEEVNRERKG